MAALDKKPRLKLPVVKRPYFHEIRKGLALGYRRNKGVGSWLVRVADGKGKSWTKAFAIADDNEDANNNTVMSYEQALKKAPGIAGVDEGASLGDKPITVAQAIDAYEADLIARNQSPRSKYNASMIRKHVKDTAIYQMPVATLKQQALADIRNKLVSSGLEPSSADRIGKCLKAALNLAASHDPRITNTKAWADGWSLLPNSSVARNIILGNPRDSAVVVAIIHAAYAADQKLGVFFDVLAETGTRESQMLRLRVRDLQDDRTDPRLMMPKDRKGKNPKPGWMPVPISPRLAAILRKACAGRSANEAILDKIDHPEDRFRAIAKIVGGVDPEATPYSFRHTSIVRMILKNQPIRVVASLHGTSVAAIERHYSAHITSITDDMTRATLPDFGIAAAA
jgi:integrase